MISSSATLSTPTSNPALTLSFIAISSSHSPSLNPIAIPSLAPTLSPTHIALKANSVTTSILAATAATSTPNLIAILAPNPTPVHIAVTSTTTNTFVTTTTANNPINTVVLITTATGEVPLLMFANDDDGNGTVTTAAASVLNKVAPTLQSPTTFRETPGSEQEDIASKRDIVAISTHIADIPLNMEPLRSVTVSAEVSEKIQYGDGNVKLIYEQYDEMFPILNGSISQKIIDDLYCLSFMMPDCKVRLSIHNPLEIRDLEVSGNKNLYVPERPEGTYQTLTAGSTYYIYVEQKEEQLRVDQEKMRKVAAGMQGATIRLDFGSRLNEETREESCSCLYGNPCVNEYGCNDWDNRSAISIKNGWKGF